MDFLIFQLLREILLPEIINELVRYPEHSQDNVSSEVLIHQPQRYDNALLSAPLPQIAVLYSLHPEQVPHLKWWLTYYFANDGDIVQMYAAISNNECQEMQPKFIDSPNPSIFVTTPTVSGIFLTLTV